MDETYTKILDTWVQKMREIMATEKEKAVPLEGGFGTTGIIYKVTYGSETLAKKYPFANINYNVEAKNYALLGGPKEGIVTCVKSDIKSGCITMRFYPYTLESLRNVLRIGDRTKIAPSILLQLTRGLKAINEVGCRHNDIKRGNVFVNYNEHTHLVEAVLGDLDGMRKFGFIGSTTPKYQAPGEAKSDHKDIKSDVFSLGDTISGFICDCEIRHIRKICTSIDVEGWFGKLIKSMLEINSSARPTPDDIILLLEGCGVVGAWASIQSEFTL